MGFQVGDRDGILEGGGRGEEGRGGEKMGKNVCTVSYVQALFHIVYTLYGWCSIKHI